MKMLYITNVSKFKYPISFSQASISACHKLGWDFHAVANRSESTPEQMAIDEKEYDITLKHLDIIRNPFSFKNLKAYKQMVELIKKENYDIIHCNTPIGGLLGRLAGKKCKVKKVIYQAHGFHFYKGAPLLNWLVYYPVERFLARFTDVLITISKEDYQRAQNFKLRNNGKVYYVPGVGIDLSQYQNPSSNLTRAKLRTELGFNNESTVCISMGDLIPRKNYGAAIAAIGRLRDKYPDLQYLVCGKGSELDNLKSLAKQFNAENNIHFLGYRSDIKDLLSAADLFLFTSLQEGLPRSTMEAMASDLPIACSRIRGNTDLIDDGEGGILFDPKNVDEITASLDKLLSSDMDTMSRYNLCRIQDFSLDTVSEKIFEIYQNELSELKELDMK